MQPQTYATHVRRPLGWGIAFACGTIALVLAGWALVSEVTLASVALVLVSLAVPIALVAIRQSAVRLQDRIIRLEMDQRLARLGLSTAAASVSLRQLIALRFASDAELPVLMARAASEAMTPDQIKRAVTSWQGDHIRV